MVIASFSKNFVLQSRSGQTSAFTPKTFFRAGVFAPRK